MNGILKATSRDRIYVLGLAIVGGNLAGWGINVIRLLVANPDSTTLWSYLAADIVAFIAVIWLVRSYRKGRRLAKAVAEKQAARELQYEQEGQTREEEYPRADIRRGMEAGESQRPQGSDTYRHRRG